MIAGKACIKLVYNVELPLSGYLPLPPWCYAMPASSASRPSRPNAYNIHLFPPSEYSLPPPPAIVAHHVWMLDCSSCGSFLTNRGMKAVLLLRPNVSLYSSDALPANCSAFAPKPGSSDRSSRPLPSSSRTCECLTQSLSCHGCGQTVGYFIVIPCVRCTSSISASNRTTNGHRFVFHASEVTGTERHYILDEPGIVPVDPLATNFPLASPYSFFSSSSVYPDHNHVSSRFQVINHEYNPHTERAYSLPTPPLDPDEPGSSPEPSPISEAGSLDYDLDSADNHRRLYSNSSFVPSATMPSLESMSFTMSPEAKEYLRVPALKDGDLLFWHHLTRTGDIPGVFDDERSRTSVREPQGVKPRNATGSTGKAGIACGR
ncbi:FAM72 protein-domain-containing protein [Flagelloscypha sp. PMI_526]|nr:FAM72 protein-domain-containing protein [Flagelloscypha sp. PMI_526]